MNHNNSQKAIFDETDSNEAEAIDEFFRQLEEREKDLHISLTEPVVEIEEPIDYGETSFEFTLPEPAPADSAKIVEEPIVQETSIANKNTEKLEQQLAEAQKKFSQLEKDRDKLRELMTRRHNDYESYRKRVEREKSELNRNIVSDMVYRMLPVVDNLGRALGLAVKVAGERSVEFQEFVSGVGLVNRQLHEVLKDLGIEQIESVGEQFDPNFHEAVAIESNPEFAPNTVTEEVLRGYRLGEKIIRHAMVKVSGNSVSVAENFQKVSEDTKREAAQDEILEFEIERF